MKSRPLWFVVGLLLAGGCAVGPNFHRPGTNPPPAFRGEPEVAAKSFADQPWWDLFQDEVLRGLIRQALTNNYDLRIAVTRVEQARALASLSRSALLPQIGYGATAARGRNVFAGTTAAPGSPLGSTSGFYVGDANLSWEIDLWGRIRRLNEAAQAQYLASEDAQRGVIITVISDVAQTYFQILALDAQLDIVRHATAAFDGTLKIFSERLQGGVASRLETSAARAALESSAATIPDLERQIALQEDQLSVLLGRNPGPIRRNDAQLEHFPAPDVPAGLPSALLERRPDLRQAEQLARSANAQIGVAVANFLPRLNLTGLLGAASPELSAITDGGAGAWGMGASLTGPIFQGGFLKAQYRQAKAARDQAVLQYQAAALNAFREVSDTLIARQKYAEARVRQARAVTAYEEAVRVANERYRGGQASYYELLQEEQQLYPAQQALTQTVLNQLLSTVQLYKALGGGWNAAAK